MHIISNVGVEVGLYLLFIQNTIQNMQYNRADGSKLSSEDKYEVKIENDEKKKSRRTKKDQEGRVFNCPCGKSYLSYPALYTHVKTKHQGRSGFLDLKIDKQISGVSSKGSTKSQKKSKKYLTHLSKLLNSHFTQNSNKKQNQSISNEITQFIKSLTVESQQKQEKVKKYNRPVSDMMGELLREIQGKVYHEAGLYLKRFLFQLAEFVVGIQGVDQDIGEEGLSDDQEEDFGKSVDIQIRKVQCGQLPNYFNQFILDKKPPPIYQQDTISKASLVLGCKVLMQLGKWMQQSGYTRYSVKYSTPLKKEEC